MAKGVLINPIIVKWAISSSKKDIQDLTNKFTKINKWITEESELSVNEINKLSKELKIPFGYFFLKEPPKEDIKLLKYRTIENEENGKPSRDLIDTIKFMETRQAFMRESLIEDGFLPLAYVASASLKNDINELATQIKMELGLKDNWNKNNRDTFRTLREAISRAGILVMQNGIVGSNTQRSLDIEEFRAFVIIDEYAPIIFLNAKDSLNAKVFSLCHELVHIWLGIDELYNDEFKLNQSFNNKHLETYCNRVAAEMLLPIDSIKTLYNRNVDIRTNIIQIAKTFNVSTLVVCIRLKNIKIIDNKTFNEIYKVLLVEVQKNLNRNNHKKDNTGGNYYNTAGSRLDRNFVHSVNRKVKEGRILYSEAYSLIGARGKVYDKLVKHMEASR